MKTSILPAGLAVGVFVSFEGSCPKIPLISDS